MLKKILKKTSRLFEEENHSSDEKISKIKNSITHFIDRYYVVDKDRRFVKLSTTVQKDLLEGHPVLEEFKEDREQLIKLLNYLEEQELPENDNAIEVTERLLKIGEKIIKRRQEQIDAFFKLQRIENDILNFQHSTQLEICKLENLMKFDESRAVEIEKMEAEDRERLKTLVQNYSTAKQEHQNLSDQALSYPEKTNKQICNTIYPFQDRAPNIFVLNQTTEEYIAELKTQFSIYSTSNSVASEQIERKPLQPTLTPMSKKQSGESSDKTSILRLIDFYYKSGQTMKKTIYNKIEGKLFNLMETSNEDISDLMDFLEKEATPANEDVKKSKLKLKNLELPQFPTKESFYFSWVANTKKILNQCNLTEDEKCIALKTNSFQENKEAALTVKNAETLTELLEMLRKKYGDRNRHCIRINNAVSSLPQMKTADPQSVIKFVETFNHLHQEALAADSKETIFNQNTYMQILKKMDLMQQSKFLSICPESLDMEGKFSKILSFLDEQLMLAYNMDALKSKDENKRVGISNSTFKPSGTDSKPRKHACFFCKKDHSLYSRECTAIQKHGIEKVRQSMRQAGYCLSCMRNDCSLSKTCREKD